MTGYTKGPWTRDKSGNIYGEDRRFVCSSNGSMSNVDWEAHQAENDANGDLIISAPDMYEALKEIEPLIVLNKDLRMQRQLEGARRALAKAEGKT